MKTKACYFFFFRRSKLLSYDLHEIQISSFLSNWKVILSSENIEKVSVKSESPKLRFRENKSKRDKLSEHAGL